MGLWDTAKKVGSGPSTGQRLATGAALGAAAGGWGNNPRVAAAAGAGASSGASIAPAEPAPAPVDYGGGSAPALDYGTPDYGTPVAPAPNPFTWDTDPTYLSALGGLNNNESTAIAGHRFKEDAVHRALADMLPKIADRAVKSRDIVKLGQEGRGLLRSGATDRLLGDVTSGEQSQVADANTQTATAIADLEQQIAGARATSDQARTELAAKYALQYASAG